MHIDSEHNRDFIQLNPRRRTPRIRYMVCVQCSWNAAAHDIVEVCADKDFSSQLNFFSDDRAQWDRRVKLDKVINVILPKYSASMYVNMNLSKLVC